MGEIKHGARYGNRTQYGVVYVSCKNPDCEEYHTRKRIVVPLQWGVAMMPARFVCLECGWTMTIGKNPPFARAANPGAFKKGHG